MKNQLYPEIATFINTLEVAKISEERKLILQELIDFIQSKKNEGKKIDLNFICTHNSRRSHLSQVWAQTMASHFNIEMVACYSGGTEATAVYPMVIETLRKTGFQISSSESKENPIYDIKFAENETEITAFSKTYDDTFNPSKAFAAIMTCSHADENCPFIVGAEKRIPIRYDDPKAFDNTSIKALKYHERSTQIATELCYVFSRIQ